MTTVSDRARPRMDAVVSGDGDFFLVIDRGGPEIASITFRGVRPQLRYVDGSDDVLPPLRAAPRVRGETPIESAKIIVMDGYRAHSVTTVPVHHATA